MSSIVAFLIILINIVSAILSVTMKWGEQMLEIWAGRIVGILIHLLLIALQYKYPVRLSPIHGPILIVSLLGYIIWGNGDSTDGADLPVHAIPSSVVGLYSSILFGMILNTCWLFTALSVVITVIVYLLYYSLVF